MADRGPVSHNCTAFQLRLLQATFAYVIMHNIVFDYQTVHTYNKTRASLRSKHTHTQQNFHQVTLGR